MHAARRAARPLDLDPGERAATAAEERGKMSAAENGRAAKERTARKATSDARAPRWLWNG